MKILQIIAFTVICLYFLVIALLYFFQSRLIFLPGKLSQDFKFTFGEIGEEVFLNTKDGQRINALFYAGPKDDVILYFHGNAGDLSGWQFVAEDFIYNDFNILIIDYRGYGKSSGSVSEKGFYEDAEAAFNFLTEKGFQAENIIIYGRSIGSGVAVDLATRHTIKGLVLEAPYTTLPDLAEEKLPFLFPSLYINFRFENLKKIQSINCPIIFIHGDADTIIPHGHSMVLFEKFQGKKKRILVHGGSHNDLNAFAEYTRLISEDIPGFF